MEQTRMVGIWASHVPSVVLPNEAAIILPNCIEVVSVRVCAWLSINTDRPGANKSEDLCNAKQEARLEFCQRMRPRLESKLNHHIHQDDSCGKPMVVVHICSGNEVEIIAVGYRCLLEVALFVRLTSVGHIQLASVQGSKCCVLARQKSTPSKLSVVGCGSEEGARARRE